MFASYKLLITSILLALSFTRHRIFGFQGLTTTSIKQDINRTPYDFTKNDISIPQSTLFTSSVSSSSSNEVTSSQSMVRNIFCNYDKPIVLLGCSSGGGNELTRLAKSFLSSLEAGTTSQSSGGEGNINSLDGIIQLTGGGDFTIYNNDIDSILKKIDTKELRWPNMLILDVGYEGVMNGESRTNNANIDAAYKTIAKQLYEEKGLLSIYINVDSTMLQEDMAKQKIQIEDNVFVPYSDYELCIKHEGTATLPSDWEHIEWEFIRLLARARLVPPIPGDKGEQSTQNCAHLTMGQHTFFLSLTFPKIEMIEPYVSDMCSDIDFMEYRTDLLDCCTNRFEVIYGMQLLRKYCRPHTVRVPSLSIGKILLEDVMPILFTVRTVNQLGKFPDTKDGISEMFQILKWGLRSGVEVLDVETAWDYTKTIDLLNIAQERYSSQILGSHHVVDKEIELEDAVGLFEQCAMNGRTHGAKVVLSIESDKKDRMAYEAALIASELAREDDEPDIPRISLILGEVGQFSRVINFPFTPVWHESLQVKAAPGQLTANELMTTRMLTGLFKPRTYGIVGHNIAYSVSPQMHGAAFAATKLPHDYTRIDVATIEEFVESELFKSDNFGGASVTIPHKQAIIPYVDVLSTDAKLIGSVNTLRIEEEYDENGFTRIVYGYNTDWVGIYNPLNRILGNTIDTTKDYALIVGAGGTARAAAYVVQKLGLKCLYYNRTPEKAQTLAESFGGTVIDSLSDNNNSASEESSSQCLGAFVGDASVGRLRVVICTLPAASNFVLPDWLLNIEKGIYPIVFDVNYKPYTTELLKQVEHIDGWTVVRGSEMLWEQGVRQFEIWTGRTAPFRVMKEIVLKNCEE